MGSTPARTDLGVSSNAFVGLSTTGQGWIVSHFACYSAAATVKGGDVVRLKHVQVISGLLG